MLFAPSCSSSEKSPSKPRILEILVEKILACTLGWNGTSGASNTDCHIFFGVSIWDLWKDRNSLVFLRETEHGTRLALKTINMAYQVEKEINCPLFHERRILPELHALDNTSTRVYQS